MIKRQIPNLITLCNLLCGVIACLFAAQNHAGVAALFILGGIFFDFFDGLTARALGVASPLGKELDSLADVVTSGVAPAFILYDVVDTCLYHYNYDWLRYIALLMPLFAAYRLGKFNLDDRQRHSFLGLPVPANALIWATCGICLEFSHLTQIALIPLTDLLEHSNTIALVLVLLSLITDILMVSEMPMFSLKFHNLTWKDNYIPYCYLLGTVLLLLLFGVIGLLFAIVWYIILSLISRKEISWS